MGERIALLSNSSAVTSRLTYTVEELLSRGLKIQGILVPEHGYWGVFSAGDPVPHGVDEYFKTPVASLYKASLDRVVEILEGSDVAMIDIQDLGLRFYTYLSATLDLMDLAARYGVNRVVVLDRPNPLGGSIVEGPVARPEFFSYVGRYSIPARYGATLGEISKLYSYEKGLGLDLEVISAKGWRREEDAIDLGISWVPPSPAIPTADTAYAYAATVYIEGTNVSEGRGTYTPFKVFGAPFIDPGRLAAELNSLGIRGALFRAVFFKPLFSKHANEICGGVYMHIIDRKIFRAFESGIKILATIYRLYGDKLEFLRSGDRYTLDLLVGDDRAREAITGGRDVDDYLASIEQEIRGYRERIAEHKIYS